MLENRTASGLGYGANGECGKLPFFPQLNGIFVINKESGPSSAQCLKPLKRLGQKKIGHAGTLDPFASGVLLALLGSATRLSEHLQQSGHKTYRGILRLGMETDTWDSTGKVLRLSEPCADAESLRAGVLAWRECAWQEIPAFSACKRNGQAFYKLARSGKETPKRVKEVKILSADLLEIDLPYVAFRVTCGSGAYIRSLAHSLGKRLGCGACLHKLTREYSYPFDLSQAATLEDLERRPELLAEKLVPIPAALPDWNRVYLNAAESGMVLNGRPISAAANSGEAGSLALLMRGETALAIGELRHESGMSMWRVKRGLWN